MVLPWRALFGVSVNESRWFVSDRVAADTTEDVAEVVIADTDPVNEVPLVSPEALFRPWPPLCPLLVVLMPLLPVVVVAAVTAPLTMHPGFA